MKEISIEADQVKRSTISDLRTAAQNEGIFGDVDVEKDKDSPGIEETKNIPVCASLREKYTCIM